MVDSSATIALLHASDQFHREAQRFFDADLRGRADRQLVALNVTSHEAFTRVRYDGADVADALRIFFFLRRNGVRSLRFCEEDESKAVRLVQKYSDHFLSFHDALCAAVMLRLGLFRIFTFDRDFFLFGFEVFPGTTGIRAR